MLITSWRVPPDSKEQEAPNQREKVLAKASGKAERNLKNIKSYDLFKFYRQSSQESKVD